MKPPTSIGNLINRCEFTKDLINIKIPEMQDQDEGKNIGNLMYKNLKKYFLKFAIKIHSKIILFV